MVFVVLSEVADPVAIEEVLVPRVRFWGSIALGRRPIRYIGKTANTLGFQIDKHNAQLIY